MAICGKCEHYFPIPESDIDFEKGKGDCVRARRDQKGQYWLSSPVFENDAACEESRAKH